MSSKDEIYIEKIAKGMTEATLEWTSSKVSLFVEKFFNKELGFIEDIETINLIKEQKNSTEWKFFKTYMNAKTDEDLRILFQMGLTLRRLESENKSLELLKKSIKKKFNVKGLHIAYFIQNEIFNKYIASCLGKITTEQQLIIEVRNLFDNIEKTVMFIKKEDDVSLKIREIINLVDAHQPKTFVISSAKAQAMKTTTKIKNEVSKKLPSYKIEDYNSPKERNIYFLNRKK